ncbi:MAG TPA: HAMP domain-containing sensor histidine kinase [Candidatus Paceibacterota bacterium]|nr:HAMP domain-containing sensor histidine kinase [Candidatus Paceibacterota bacterium]
MAGLMIPILVFASTKLSLLGFDLSNCDRAAVEGPMAQYGYLLELFFVCWIIIAAIIRYKKSKEPDFRSQIVIMSSALCIFLLSFSLGNIVEVFTDNWGVGQIGLIGVPVFIAFLSYLIVRYKAFSIKLMGAQALVMVLGFLVLSLLFVRTLEDARYVILGTFIIVLVVGYLLVRSVKREIEQRHRLQDLTLSLEKSNLSLAEANDKLKGLDKLKTEFLSLASHQLRSPLTAIKGYASMLSEGAFGSLDSKQDEAIKRIYTSAQGLTNIVEDLLNVSKIEQGGMKYEFSPTSLSAIVTTLYNEMKVPAESKSLEFSLEMDSHDQYIVSADATKIKQVFLNLVDNSIKYTPKGFVKIFLKREGANIVFSVLDSGMGISPETRAKLFEKFSRGEGGKTNTGGSGLGLYLAQQIARAHKGDVTIESPGLGKGSTFIVTLPASGSYPN